jgi:hypothetical protein
VAPDAQTEGGGAAASAAIGHGAPVGVEEDRLSVLIFDIFLPARRWRISPTPGRFLLFSYGVFVPEFWAFFPLIQT